MKIGEVSRTVISTSKKRRKVKLPGTNIESRAYTQMIVYKEMLANGKMKSTTQHEMVDK